MTTEVASEPVVNERPEDAWRWVAYLFSGRVVREADDTPFAEALNGDCYAVEMEPKRSGLPAFSLQLAPGERPVCFRRRSTIWLVSGEMTKATIHCLGREMEDGSQGVYVFWDDEGHVVITGDRQAI